MKNFYILLDIDGCITNGKNQPIDLPSLHQLQQLIKKNKLNVFLCTGRSATYVEAICQLLHIDNWCICENGCYLYHPLTDEIIINTSLPIDSLEYLKKIKSLLNNSEYRRHYNIELGKEICISLNPIDIDMLSLYQYISQSLDAKRVNINYSTTAVDITPRNIDKGSGYDFWYKFMNIKKETIGIGDSNGDIPFLEKCNIVACPNNADTKVKSISSIIATQDSTLGVVQILQSIVSNKKY